MGIVAFLARLVRLYLVGLNLGSCQLGGVGNHSMGAGAGSLGVYCGADWVYVVFLGTTP